MTQDIFAALNPCQASNDARGPGCHGGILTLVSGFQTARAVRELEIMRAGFPTLAFPVYVVTSAVNH